jgi:hypothetical protein
LKVLTETLLRIPFSDWSMFSCAYLSLAAGKSAIIELSPVAFGILQNLRRLPVSIVGVKIAALGSLKQVTGRFFKIT